MTRVEGSAGRGASLAARPHGDERRPGLHAIGVAATRLAAPIVARRGGVLARLKAQWAAIVGPEWAAVSWPQALGRDGRLQLRATSTAALELQHRAPLLIERINLFFGGPRVSRIALVQGPLPQAAPPPARRPPRPLAPAEAEAIAAQVAAIADPGLREALLRLGRAIAAAEVAPRRQSD